MLWDSYLAFACCLHVLCNLKRRRVNGHGVEWEAQATWSNINKSRLLKWGGEGERYVCRCAQDTSTAQPQPHSARDLLHILRRAMHTLYTPLLPALPWFFVEWKEGKRSSSRDGRWKKIVLNKSQHRKCRHQSLYSTCQALVLALLSGWTFVQQRQTPSDRIQ